MQSRRKSGFPLTSRMALCFFLLTDFGLSDPYVGQMKAAIRSRVPEAGFLDLSHGVRPHNIVQAAFFLASSWPYLPRGSTGLAVVDPGVGTSRSILLLRQDERSVLAPDNGLIGLLLDSRPGCRVWRMRPPLKDQEVSATFHGRDVFAPLACQLAQGEDPSLLGEPMDPAICWNTPGSRPHLEGNRVQAGVVHVDRFGNCVLNLKSEQWAGSFPAGRPIKLVHPRRETIRSVSTYALIPNARVGLLAGSQGYLELACNQRSCAQHLGLDIGDECILSLG